MFGDPSSTMLGGAQGLLTLVQTLAMAYFAFVTWRSGAGRLATVFLVAVVAEAVLSGMGVLMGWGGMLFAYSSGTEAIWTMLSSLSMMTGTIRTVALLVAAVAFLLLALRAKKNPDGPEARRDCAVAREAVAPHGGRALGLSVPAGGNNNAGAPFRTRFAFSKTTAPNGSSRNGWGASGFLKGGNSNAEHRTANAEWERGGSGVAQGAMLGQGGRNTQCRTPPLSLGVRLSALAFWIWFLGMVLKFNWKLSVGNFPEWTRRWS